MTKMHNLNRILRKYPCDRNGIMTAGIDLIRHDLAKLLKIKPVQLSKIKVTKGQCRHMKEFKDTLRYCILDVGHKGKHEFWLSSAPQPEKAEPKP